MPIEVFQVLLSAEYTVDIPVSHYACTSALLFVFGNLRN